MYKERYASQETVSLPCIIVISHCSFECFPWT